MKKVIYFIISALGAITSIAILHLICTSQGINQYNQNIISLIIFACFGVLGASVNKILENGTGGNE